MRPIVYILNGPNLNLLGTRQPEIYGCETLADVEAASRRIGAELGLEIRVPANQCRVSLIDWIHEARLRAAGIVINPAALSHTSVAVLDALNTCEFPILEVLSLTFIAREFRLLFRESSAVREHADAGAHLATEQGAATPGRQRLEPSLTRRSSTRICGCSDPSRFQFRKFNSTSAFSNASRAACKCGASKA